MSVELDDIKHEGRIVSIDGEKIYVSIMSKSACASCHAKGMCTVSEMKEKIIEVCCPEDQEFKVGEKVVVSMRKSSGNKAVFLGYFLPFLILVTALFTLNQLFEDEGIAALISIGILIPYYLILFIRKEKIKKKFNFYICKAD
jgi:sigma-E factor negative regulatory protein RseC